MSDVLPSASTGVAGLDDANLVLTNATAMLEDLGHTALRASSGDAALDILSDDHSVDLVNNQSACPT